MTVHIEGMGWLGSLTAHQLARAGVEFTWSDTDTRWVAWPASTGLVYPTGPGDEQSQRGMRGWQRWLADDPWLARYVVPALFAYSTKTPPHHGAYERSEIAPGLTIAHAPCYASDPRALVLDARAEFADRRLPSTPDTPVLVQAHSAGRLRSFMWGWSARVKVYGSVETDDPIAYYGRRISQPCYANPVGATGLHYAGSTVVEQRTPKSLDCGKHYRLWESWFLKQFPSVDRVEVVEPPTEGWRPRPLDDDSGLAEFRREGGQTVITTPPLGHSGVRWAPPVIDSIVHSVLEATA